MRKFFPKLTVKALCTLGLLLAITALLAIFCTFRIGTAIKIPFKFISVFITSVLFGPFFGGLIGALGDLLNCILAPSGPIIPQIIAIEFLSGFVYGICFLNIKHTTKSYLIRTVICVLIQFLIDMLLTTSALIHAGYFTNFTIAFSARILAGVIKPAIQGVVIISLKNYINRFKQLAI